MRVLKNLTPEWRGRVGVGRHIFIFYLFFSAKGEVVKLEPSCCTRLKENLLKGKQLTNSGLFFYY